MIKWKRLKVNCSHFVNLNFPFGLRCFAKSSIFTTAYLYEFKCRDTLIVIKLGSFEESSQNFTIIYHQSSKIYTPIQTIAELTVINLKTKIIEATLLFVSAHRTLSKATQTRSKCLKLHSLLECPLRKRIKHLIFV